jgi:RHS repeat-associated protein
MASLLQAAGYTTAAYQTGTITIDAANLTGWLGTDDSVYSAGFVFEHGGFDPTVITNMGMTQMLHVRVPWAWVKVQISGTNYVFDPAGKRVSGYARTPKISNLASAIGYSQPTFVSDAKSGATTTDRTISGLNRSGERDSLRTYSQNLVNYIRTNNPAAKTSDIIGGTTIVPLAVGTQQRLTSLSYLFSSATDHTCLPTSLRTELTLAIPGASAITFNTSDIYGHRLSLFFDSQLQPVLRLDGVEQRTGSAASSGSAVTITTSINHPYLSNTAVDVSADQSLKVTATTTGAYVISNGWGPVGRGMIERRRLLLKKATADNPGNPDAESVLGESLTMIGYTWLAEGAFVRQVVDQLADTVTIRHHAVGIVGIRPVGASTGPFVDIPLNASGFIQRDDHSASSTMTASEAAAFFTGLQMQSVLESGVIEQTQPGAIAVSTAKLIDIASQSDTIFDINNDAVSGDDATYYTNTIRPMLDDTWASGDLTRLDSLVNTSDYRVIAPLTGNMMVNGLWTGVGYYTANQAGTAIGAIISGGLSGGLPASLIPNSDVIGNTSSSVQPSSASGTVGIAGTISQAWSDAVGVFFDPVNRVTGSFTYSHLDLTVGRAGFPIGLGFQRSYDSAAGLNAGPLGLGWTHNFAVAANKDSDGFEGLAVNSPINGASAIAALYVVQDLMTSTTAKPLDRTVISTIAVTWLMEQLTNNVVTITEPANVTSFVLLADGSYNPPFGSSNRLQLSAGAYVLTQVDGTVLTFNDVVSAAPGSISTWHSPTGPTVTYTYDGSGYLTTVSTGSGAAGSSRTLTLSYDGSNRLAGVSDGTGRSVSYSYDSNGNLSRYTDPLGNVTTYAYDSPGRMTQYFPPASTGIPLVSNAYDELGRVTAQTDANGNVSHMYFAGWRTETVDPLGNAHVYYFSPRGKNLIDIDELGRKTVNTYDGLDRLVATTLPEGGSIAFAYDATTNPWANNIAAITRNPKPGSPLSAIVQSFTYDSLWNKVATATDGRGIVTKNVYDGATGSLTKTVADYSTDSGHFNAATTFTYNALGQVASATNSIGVVTQSTYDQFGNPISITRDTGGLGQTTSFAHSDQGDVISVTDPNGNITRSTYDAARRLTSVVLAPTGGAPGSVVTTYSYDADGRLLETVESVEGTELRKTTATYTALGQVAKTVDPKGSVSRFVYDAGGLLTSVTDPVGRVTSYTYDDLGRRIGVFNTGIQMGALLQQSYTDGGQLASLTDANGNVTSFAYDGFDRLATTTYPGSSNEAFTYDADSNVLSRKNRFGDTISYTYDTLNRMTAMTPPPGTPTVNYSYDLVGHRTAVSGDGPAITAPAPPGGIHASYATSYTYDALNRQTGASWGNAPAQTTPTASSATFMFGYDVNNRRIREDVTDNAWLSYPSSASATTYTSNALNQYTAVGSESLTYDANGNLAKGATFDRQPSGPAGTTNFVTDADGREVLEYNGSNGTILRWYAYGLGANEVLNLTDVPANTRKALIPGAQGSIAATLDSGTGALTKQSYQSYGESDNAAAGFAYTGQRLDAQTGLYYYRARMYSPALGRFLQPDPIGYASGANLYAYVNDDPLNLVDPNGLFVEQLGTSVSSVWNYPLSSVSVPHLLSSCIDPESCFVTQQAFGTMTYSGPLTVGDIAAPVIEIGSLAVPAFRAGTAAGLGARAAPILPEFSTGGGTAGILRTAAGDIPLQSGWAGPALSVPKGTSGFDIITRTHVEGHAAAIMRQSGISEATLYINNPTICVSCTNLLPRMLPTGSRLDVITPSGRNPFLGSVP